MIEQSFQDIDGILIEISIFISNQKGFWSLFMSKKNMMMGSEDRFLRWARKTPPPFETRHRPGRQLLQQQQQQQLLLLLLLPLPPLLSLSLSTFIINKSSFTDFLRTLNPRFAHFVWLPFFIWHVSDGSTSAPGTKTGRAGTVGACVVSRKMEASETS